MVVVPVTGHRHHDIVPDSLGFSPNQLKECLLGSRTEQVGFRDVFAVGEFRMMWAAEAASKTGEQLARVALAILVYQRTESATLTGLTYALTLAPSLLGGVFLSGLADRFPRREVMVVADLLRAVLIGLVAIPGTPFPVLCVLVAGVSFFQAPFKAAQLALLPDVLPGELFVVGMGIRTITMQTAQMIAFAGGGVLLTAVRPPVGLLLDTVTFLVSATLVRFGVRYRPAAVTTAAAAARDGTASPGWVVSSVATCAWLIWRERGLRTLVVFSWLSGLLIVYEGLAAPYTAEIGGGTIAVGLLLAADPMGSAIGAFVFTRLVPAALRPRMLGVLAIASCLPLLGCLARPGLAASLLLFAVAGALGTALLIQATMSFSFGLPDHSRAQALGLGQSGTTAVQGLGPLLVGAAADTIGTARAVGLVGILGLAIAVPAATSWRRATTDRPGM